MDSKNEKTSQYDKSSKIEAYVIGTIMSVLSMMTILGGIFAPNIDTAIVNQRIAGIKDPQQKEIAIATQKIRSNKTISLKYGVTIRDVSISIDKELRMAVQVLSDKNHDVKTNRVNGLQYIINAKGYLQQLKELNIPIDTQMAQIREVEHMLYQNVSI
jgi:hypothetical protein